MRPRYLLCPGYILSKYDGDTHFISAGQLKSLYGVHWQDCDIEKREIDHNRYRYIRLFPRYDGDYTKLPRLKDIEEFYR